MNTAWTKGIKKDTQYHTDVRAAFKEAVLLRKRLGEILSDKFESNATSRLSATSYENAGWAYTQADAVGYARAIKEILTLLEDK